LAAPNPEPSVGFSLEKIYIKDVSYEAPNAPAAFTQSGAPEVNVQLSIEHAKLDPEHFEVVLSVTLTAKREGKSLFLVEVQQAGVFRVSGVAGETLTRTLEIACPYVLLPFARETISNLVERGGFPQLLINPINFDALYEQKGATPQQSGGTA